MANQRGAVHTRLLKLYHGPSPTDWIAQDPAAHLGCLSLSLLCLRQLLISHLPDLKVVYHFPVPKDVCCRLGLFLKFILKANIRLQLIRTTSTPKGQAAGSPPSHSSVVKSDILAQTIPPEAVCHVAASRVQHQMPSPLPPQAGQQLRPAPPHTPAGTLADLAVLASQLPAPAASLLCHRSPTRTAGQTWYLV